MAVCGEKDKVESFGGRDEHSDVSEEVTCPVCGNKVRGNNFTFNSHLDMCLSRGTKRKLTQRTLLQMNFCLSEKVQIRSSKREQSGRNLLPISVDERTVVKKVTVLDTGNVSKSVLNLRSALHKDGLSKSSICDDKTDENIVTHFLSENNEVPDDGMAITLDDISGVILVPLLLVASLVMQRK